MRICYIWEYVGNIWECNGNENDEKRREWECFLDEKAKKEWEKVIPNENETGNRNRNRNKNENKMGMNKKR